MNEVKDAVETFRKHLWNQSNIISVKTVNQYTSVFSKLLRFCGGNTNGITEINIKKYLKTINSRIAIRQIKTVVSYASQIFDDIENMSDNSWKDAQIFKKKVVNSRLPYSSKAMLTRIFSVDDETAQVMMLLSLHTGCRMGALSKLQSEDYDYETKTMTLVEKGNKVISYIIDEFTLSDRLESLIEKSKDSKPLYSMRTIQSHCENIGLQAHDFRRLYSKKIMDHYEKQGYGEEEALKKTKEAMNHENVSTTYGYASYGSIKLTKRKEKNHEK